MSSLLPIIDRSNLGFVGDAASDSGSEDREEGEASDCLDPSPSSDSRLQVAAGRLPVISVQHH